MKKYRLTPTKTALLKILESSPAPISVDDILKQLKVNKTTIYRQLDSLIHQSFVTPVHLADRIIRYEIAARNHHHHLVCLNCRQTQDITFTENIEDSALVVAASRKFKIQFHQLEFFGLCANCQTC